MLLACLVQILLPPEPLNTDMDAALFTPSPLVSPGNSAPSTLDSASPLGQTVSPGGDFGTILSSLQPLQGRQDLAAVLFAQTPTIGQLVSVPLGSNMAVITPEGTPPSQDSLVAFARSQGLDETAIAALWQPSPGQTELATLTTSTSTSSSAASLPSHPVAQAIASPMAMAELTAQSQPAPTPVAANTSLPRHAAQALVLGLTIQSDHPPTAVADGTAPTPEEPGLDLAALQGMRAHLLMQGQRPANRPSPQATPAPDPLMTPGQPIKTPEIPVIELDLGDELARIGQSALASAAAETPAATATEARPTGPSQPLESRPAPSPSSPQSTLSGYQLKAEHYQQLADRMGQALAQRMLEQIDQGQWSMKLRLNPAELGQIDVRLEMRHAGLDAHFQADNPLTKELIQQGAGRLKDNLVQNGMTLASMSVGSDAERQSGGNPTPQHEQRRASPEQATVQTRNEPSREAPASKKTRADGWDMLA